MYKKIFIGLCMLICSVILTINLNAKLENGRGCSGPEFCFDTDWGGGGSSLKYGAKIVLFSVASTTGDSNSFINDSGHSFIYVENMSDSYTFKVGYMSIAPNNGVTLGTWGNRTFDGIWYNLESYFYHYYNAYYGRVSLSETKIYTKQIDLDNFVKPMNDYILKNNTWSIFNTCATFTKNIWNSISVDRKVTAGSPNLPVDLCSSIRTYSTYTEIQHLKIIQRLVIMIKMVFLNNLK